MLRHFGPLAAKLPRKRRLIDRHGAADALPAQMEVRAVGAEARAFGAQAQPSCVDEDLARAPQRPGHASQLPPSRAIADDWKHHEYYAEAEHWLAGFWDGSSAFRRFFDKINRKDLLELACGHGRHSAQIIDSVDTLTLVDVNQENIDACRVRFAKYQNVRYIANNGNDLSAVAGGSQTGLFCYDAMVHFEASDVIDYLSEISRILTPGGRAVLHYSNMHWMPGVSYGDGPHMRNFFSENMMIHFAARNGLQTLEHTTLDWGSDPIWRDLDALILLEKAL